MAVRIGERVRRVEPELPGSRLILEDGAVGDPHRRPPRRLALRVLERALLKEERAGGVEREAVGCMVGIGGVEASHERNPHVVDVVAVGVLQVFDTRRQRHDHALPPELERDRIVEVVGEGLHAIGFPVAVGVFQDQDLVLHLFVRPPVRVALPGGHPEPAFGIEAHRHRIHEFRKHPLVGDQFDLHAGMHGHLADGLLTGEELMLAPRQRPRLVGDDVDQFRQPDIFHCGQRRVGIGKCGGRGPDPPIAVGRLDVEVVELPLSDLVVGLALDELQPRAAAVRGIAVGDAIPVEPEKILVGHGLLEAGKRLRIAGGMRAKERLVDDPGNLAVAPFVGMDAVGRERLGNLCVALLRGREEIDTLHAVGLADLFHRVGVELQVGIMRATISPVRPLQVFMRDRGKHHQFRSIDTVVFLLERVLDEGFDMFLEGVEAGGPGMGLVCAKEGEDHVGLRTGEFKPVLADGRLVLDVVWLGDRRRPREPLVGRAEVGTTEPLREFDLVAVVAEVADHEPLLRKPALEQGLEPAAVLHAVGHATADDADVVAFLDIEPAGLGPS